MEILRRTGACTSTIPAERFNFAAYYRPSYRAILIAVTASLLALCSGCGGSSNSSSDTVSIALSPQTTTLPVSSSAQFTATVSGSSNTSVTWQVNGTVGGSSTYGTISSSGLYTAPNAVPASAITITAVAQADTSKTATANVTVTNTNTLVVSPAQATLAAGGQQTFSATLGDQTMDAAWSLSCSSTLTGGCGTISANGVYTAPLSPPPGGSVTITASSKNNTANPDTANVVIQFGAGTLFGRYTFTLTGVDAGQPFRSAGSIQFDGKGGIVGGIEDRSGVAIPVTITGGTYASDGQGRVATTIHTDSGDQGWQITLVNHTRAVVMRVDSVIARGTLDLQDPAQFGRSLNGNYSFHLSGSATSGVSYSATIGALAFDQMGNVTSGLLDSNDGGAVVTNQTVIGSSTASDSSNGRGTLSVTSSLGTQTFAYYIVSPSSANLIETDGVHDFLGKLAWRTSSTVDTSQFAGNYAFVFSGANGSGTVGQGGTFVVDRNGNISNGSFDVVTDTAFSLGFLVSGSLVVADPVTGRSVVTLSVGASTLQYVVYPPSSGDLAFLEIDNQNATSGLARLSTAIGGSIPSVSGPFALLAGETTTAVRRIVSGNLALAPTPTGTLDVNDNGNTTLGTALQNSSFSVTSVYGRGQLQLQAGTYKATYGAYVVDTDRVLVMQTDGKGVLTGIMQRQY
jgi:hypothetical protein